MPRVSNHRSNWASSRSIPGYDQETPGQLRARTQGERYGDYLSDHLAATPHFYDTSSYHSPLSTIAERSTRDRYRANTGYNLPESPF